MKCVILLGIIVTIVTSLPVDQNSSSQYILQVIEDNYPRKVIIEANHQDVNLIKISSNITKIRIHRNVESSNREIDLADLSSAELAKLQIRVRGEITRTIPFTNPTTLQEAEAEITQYRGSIWIHAEGGNRGGRIHIGGTITFNEKELDKLMQKELVKLGVKIDNADDVTAIVESVEIKDIEILPFSELAKSKKLWSRNLEEKEANLFDMPRTELALRIRVRGKINIRIRFADPAALATAQLAQNRGSIWIRGEGDNREENIQIGGTIRFNAEQLDAVELEGVRVLPAESSAELSARREN